MKVEKYNVKPEPMFQPFQLVITFQSENEVKTFFNAMNYIILKTNISELYVELINEIQRQGLKV